jgi:hypothetical protein
MLIATCHPDPSAGLLKEALLHDAAERRGPGDIRFQAKRDNPALKALAESIEADEFIRLGLPTESGLSASEEKWLKWADMAEVALYARNLYQDCGYPCALKIWGEAVPVIKERVAGLGIAAVQITNELYLDYKLAMEG